MEQDHGRFEELAVGHVLGGLAEDDASAFRAHLLDCRHCRRRVAELRDLASDLHAVEREERAALRVRTETQQNDRDEADEPTDKVRIAVAPAAAVVVLLAVLLLGFWNYHLRSQNDALLRATEAREQLLASFAEGDLVVGEFADGVSGTIVRDGPRVAFTLSGIPDLTEGERLVVWLETSDGITPVAVITEAELDDGRLATVHRESSARRLLVTVEPMTIPEEPSGPTLVEAPLVEAAASTPS